MSDTKSLCTTLMRLLVTCVVLTLVACGGAPGGSTEHGDDADSQDDAGDGGVVTQPDTGTVATSDAGMFCSPALGLGTGTTRCDGNDVQTCGADGKWGKAKPCPETTVCMAEG